MTDAAKEKRGILPQDKLVVFEDKKIRRSFHKGEWYFSIIDIVDVLTGSPNSAPALRYSRFRGIFWCFLAILCRKMAKISKNCSKWAQKWLVYMRKVHYIGGSGSIGIDLGPSFTTFGPPWGIRDPLLGQIWDCK